MDCLPFVPLSTQFCVYFFRSFSKALLETTSGAVALVAPSPWRLQSRYTPRKFTWTLFSLKPSSNFTVYVWNLQSVHPSNFVKHHVGTNMFCWAKENCLSKWCGLMVQKANAYQIIWPIFHQLPSQDFYSLTWLSLQVSSIIITIITIIIIIIISIIIIIIIIIIIGNKYTSTFYFTIRNKNNAKNKEAKRSCFNQKIRYLININIYTSTYRPYFHPQKNQCISHFKLGIPIHLPGTCSANLHWDPSAKAESTALLVTKLGLKLEQWKRLVGVLVGDEILPGYVGIMSLTMT